MATGQSTQTKWTAKRGRLRDHVLGVVWISCDVFCIAFKHLHCRSRWNEPKVGCGHRCKFARSRNCTSYGSVLLKRETEQQKINSGSDSLLQTADAVYSPLWLSLSTQRDPNTESPCARRGGHPGPNQGELALRRVCSVLVMVRSSVLFWSKFFTFEPTKFAASQPSLAKQREHDVARGALQCMHTQCYDRGDSRCRHVGEDSPSTSFYSTEMMRLLAPSCSVTISALLTLPRSDTIACVLTLPICDGQTQGPGRVKKT